jgi:hypothetical protein
MGGGGIAAAIEAGASDEEECLGDMAFAVMESFP